VGSSRRPRVTRNVKKIIDYKNGDKTKIGKCYIIMCMAGQVNNRFRLVKLIEKKK